MAGKMVDSLRRSLRLNSNTSGTRSSNGSSSFAGSSLFGEEGLDADADADPDYEAFLDGPAREKRCVVGIDFGTTNSGFAYALTSDARIHVVRKKEPTCAMFRRKDKKLVKYGLEARELYYKTQAAHEFVSNMKTREQRARLDSEYIYIDQDVKMWLFEASGGMALDQALYPSSGGLLTYFEVVAGILEHIKDLALERVSADLRVPLEELQPHDVLWVLTVPSICGESEKQFMRRAAREAGIIPDDFSGDLVIALESECAAVWAEAVFDMEEQRLAAAQAHAPPGALALRRSRNRPAHRPLKSGETVLCLDCGGGTIDIAAVRVLHARREGSETTDMTMDQLLPPVGLKLGAQDIDRRFYRFLRKFLGKEGYADAWRQNASRAELQDGWERIKVSLKMEAFEYATQAQTPPSPVQSSQSQSQTPKQAKAAAAKAAAARVQQQPGLAMPVTLTELNARLPDLVARYNKGSLQQAEAQARKPGKSSSTRPPIQLSYRKSRTRASTVLLLPPELLHACFDDVVDRILAQTEFVMNNYLGEGVDHLILYGGLGNAVYLRHRVAERFRDVVDVRLAHQASLAVMKGAVKYGLFPRIVNSRRARMTVGVKVSIPFVRGKHNRKPHMAHKAYDEQTREYYVRDVFRTFVTRGQLVDVDEVYKHMFVPANKHKDTIKFDIYGSLADSVEYVTEPGCFKLARIVVPITRGDMSKVTCALSFGHTEIRAAIIDDNGNVVREVPLLFDRVGEHAIMSAANPASGDMATADTLDMTGVTPRAGSPPDKGADAGDEDDPDFALA